MDSNQLTAAGRVAFVFLWLFVFALPMEKVVMIPGLGSLAKLLGAAALAAGLGAVLIDARIRPLNRAHALLAVFAVWIVVTIRWSISPEATAEKATTFVQLLSIVWLAWEFCPSQERILLLTRAYVFGAIWASFDTVSRWLLARQTYYQRYAATGFDPNDLALTLAISIPLSYMLAARAQGVRAAVYWVQIALAIMAVLLSASRTGFLSTLLAGAIVPLTFTRLSRIRRVLVCAGVAAVLLAAPLLVPRSSWKRLSTISSEVPAGKLNMREAIWGAGMRVLREHPIAGVGSGGFERSVEPVMGWPKQWAVVAHNTFFSVLVETGVVGFTLFFAFLVAIGMSVARMPGMDRATWGVVLAVWTAGATTLTWETRKPTWLIFALILAQARLHRPLERLRPAAWRALPLPKRREVALP